MKDECLSDNILSCHLFTVDEKSVEEFYHFAVFLNHSNPLTRDPLTYANDLSAFIIVCIASSRDYLIPDPSYF